MGYAEAVSLPYEAYTSALLSPESPGTFSHLWGERIKPNDRGLHVGGP